MEKIFKTTIELPHDSVCIEVTQLNWLDMKLARIKFALQYFWANIIAGRRQKFERKKLESGYLRVSWERKK